MKPITAVELLAEPDATSRVAWASIIADMVVLPELTESAAVRSVASGAVPVNV